MTQHRRPTSTAPPNQQPAEGPVAPVVYVHIPKAAGTSLKNILARAYAGRPMLFFTPRLGELDRFRALPPAQRRRLAVLAGHEPFGLQDAFKGCGLTPAVITVLREPVSRVVSLFHYIHRDPEHPRHSEFVAAGTTLSEVYTALRLPAFDNHQVRFLAGPGARDKPFGALTDADLEQAKRNLASGCRAFGLQERFDDSVEWFARLLRWPATEKPDLNAAPRRSRPEDVTPADRDLIRAHNALDARLYDFARALFEERRAV
jgi:hypothetical protein